MDQSATVLDIDFGMSQLSGNKTLLLTLLNKFSDEYRTLGDDLQALVEQGDFDNAYSLIHTLKGVTGNLGLFALHEASKPVELSVRNDKRLPDDYTAFVYLLSQTMSAIETLSAAPVAEAPAKQDSVAAEHARQQLLAALKASEFISQSKLDEWLNAISLPAEAKQHIENAVDELDYEEAISQLDKA